MLFDQANDVGAYLIVVGASSCHCCDVTLPVFTFEFGYSLLLNILLCGEHCADLFLCGHSGERSGFARKGTGILRPERVAHFDELRVFLGPVEFALAVVF